MARMILAPVGGIFSPSVQIKKVVGRYERLVRQKTICLTICMKLQYNKRSQQQKMYSIQADQSRIDHGKHPLPWPFTTVFHPYGSDVSIFILHHAKKNVAVMIRTGNETVFRFLRLPSPAFDISLGKRHGPIRSIHFHHFFYPGQNNLTP